MHSAMHSALPPRAQALGNGTTVLVGMPGAFTPTCTDQHLPGFIKQSETLKSLGVERVCVITTNDRYVNSAWNGAIEECMSTKSGALPSDHPYLTLSHRGVYEHQVRRVT